MSWPRITRQEWLARATEMDFVGGPLDGQKRLTLGIGFDSNGALYRPRDGKMHYIGHRHRASA